MHSKNSVHPYICFILLIQQFKYIIKSKVPCMSVQIHCFLFLPVQCFSGKAEGYSCLNRVCKEEPKWLLLKAAFLYVYET